ncbi:low temperature-induced protein [Acinetobacter sp. CUI P1]|nr:low temperature-induced protein [Acinetobacter sp. CUI P1]
MTKKIVGIFDTEQEATRAIEGLHNQGFSNDEISVITRDRDELRHISDDTGTKAPEGVATGAATGGVLGGVTGLLAGIGALAIPGIGPILAAGPIVATLTGVAVGAGAGGLVGGLIGLGIPEDEAKEYEGYVESGKILVLVEDNGRGYQAHDVFRDNRSLNAQRYESVYNEDTRLGNSMANRADRTAEVYNRDKI